MFGHEDVALYAEFVLLPGFFEDFEEDLFNSMVVKQRMPLVTTAGDEMRGVGIVTAFEETRHELRLRKLDLYVGDGGHRFGVVTFLHPTLFQRREKDGAPTFKISRGKKGGARIIKGRPFRSRLWWL